KASVEAACEFIAVHPQATHVCPKRTRVHSAALRRNVEKAVFAIWKVHLYAQEAIVIDMCASHSIATGATVHAEALRHRGASRRWIKNGYTVRRRNCTRHNGVAEHRGKGKYCNSARSHFSVSRGSQSSGANGPGVIRTTASRFRPTAKPPPSPRLLWMSA